jgi:hypothetical protein
LQRKLFVRGSNVAVGPQTHVDLGIIIYCIQTVDDDRVVSKKTQDSLVLEKNVYSKLV